jgi:hypothetical protein
MSQARGQPLAPTNYASCALRAFKRAANLADKLRHGEYFAEISVTIRSASFAAPRPAARPGPAIRRVSGVRAPNSCVGLFVANHEQSLRTADGRCINNHPADGLRLGSLSILLAPIVSDAATRVSGTYTPPARAVGPCLPDLATSTAYWRVTWPNPPFEARTPHAVCRISNRLEGQKPIAGGAASRKQGGRHGAEISCHSDPRSSRSRTRIRCAVSVQPSR